MQINKKMSEKTNIRIGVSIGDLNGVGLEVVMKTFADERMLDFCTPVLFASNKVIAFGKKQFGIDFTYNGIVHLNSIIDHKINVMNIWRELPPIQLGVPTPESGQCALDSLSAAVAALKEGLVDVLVTAPINKKNIQSESFHFPGHTDYLAQELEGDSLMFMVSDELRVGLLTDHLPKGCRKKPQSGIGREENPPDGSLFTYGFWSYSPQNSSIGYQPSLWRPRGHRQ